mmetsp:Transcript_12783/g.26051  ORF Transcript_12783/g.26051 Transcript_12783/m.26051 type:complete len:298 (+) Transcript_12783:1697-2590(+)
MHVFDLQSLSTLQFPVCPTSQPGQSPPPQSMSVSRASLTLFVQVSWVGAIVGDGVGEPVGERVGLAVGVAVGAGVGDGVGEAVGEGVGLTVGEAVGAGVGGAEGAGVGGVVGAGVGDSVGPPQMPPSRIATCMQFPVEQSEGTLHFLLWAQPGHEGPPQSVSVSSPFFKPSTQVEAVGAGVGPGVGGDVVGAGVGASPQNPPLQFSLSQSVETRQACPSKHGEQEPPQSVSVSSPSIAPFLQIGSVGDLVGAGVGEVVGAALGAGVGEVVGAGVGAAVPRPKVIRTFSPMTPASTPV